MMVRVLWFMAGWFALSVVVSLITGRMMHRASLADLDPEVPMPAAPEEPARDTRPRLAA